MLNQGESERMLFGKKRYDAWLSKIDQKDCVPSESS